MNILCDFFLLAVVVVCAVLGRKNGFVKTVFDLFGTLISFCVAWFLHDPLAGFLDQNVFRPFLAGRFLSALQESTGLSPDRIDLGNLPATQAVADLLSRFHTDPAGVGSAADAASGAGDVLRTAAETVVSPLSSLLAAVSAFVALLLVSFALIRILAAVFDWISRLPVLKTCNKALGLVAGLLLGLLIVFLLSAVLSAAAPLVHSLPGPFWQDFDPERTYVLRFFARFDFLQFITRYFTVFNR